MSEIEESAKAVQEIAKATGKGIDKIETMERIGKSILGPFGEGWGILTDMTKRKREELAWRAENRLKIYELAQAKLAKIDIAIDNVDPVPPRIAYDYEDGIEREDEPSLQELWANLLVNSTKPNGIIPQREFREILGRMESDDAIFLNIIWPHSGSGTELTLNPGPSFPLAEQDLNLSVVEDPNRQKLINVDKLTALRNHAWIEPDSRLPNDLREEEIAPSEDFRKTKEIPTTRNWIPSQNSPIPLIVDRLSSYGLITSTPVGMTLSSIGNAKYKLTSLGKAFVEAVSVPITSNSDNH